MTSNLPVAGQGVAQLAGVVRESREVGEARRTGGPGALDFASVLAEVMAARGPVENGSAAVRAAATPAAAASASAGTGLAEARFARALAADAPMQWLAAPLVHRAIDAYRELMNVSA